MRYEAFIARRYLRAKRRIALVSVISTIAMIGVMVGVAALVCTLAVFNGFSNVVTSMLVGFDPHLRIESASGGAMHDGARIAQLVRATPGVTAAAPVVAGRVMIVHKNLMQVATVRGVTPAIAAAGGVERSVTHGAFDLGGDAAPGAVLGIVLADRLHVSIGDTLLVVSPAGIEAAYTQLAQPVTLHVRVTGVYASLNKEYDAHFAYLALPQAQRLFERAPDEVDDIDVRCDDIAHAGAVQAALVRAFAAAGDSVRVETWYDLHRDLYSVMAIERWIAYILLSLIVVVAAFTVLGSLTMTVIEKQRDISLLKAAGATNAGVRNIFLLAGTIIGIVGAAAGAVLGYAMCWAQQTFQIFKLSSQFIIPAMPVDMRPMDFVQVGLSAIVLCMLAALYPARRAARVLPAEGLRWE